MVDALRETWLIAPEQRQLRTDTIGPFGDKAYSLPSVYVVNVTIDGYGCELDPMRQGYNP